MLDHNREYEQAYFYHFLIIRNQSFVGYQVFFFVLKSYGNTRGSEKWKVIAAQKVVRSGE